MRARRCERIAAAVGDGVVRRSVAGGGSFSSPRAWAFTLLGLDAYCGGARDSVARASTSPAEKLLIILSAVESKDGVV